MYSENFHFIIRIFKCFLLKISLNGVHRVAVIRVIRANISKSQINEGTYQDLSQYVDKQWRCDILQILHNNDMGNYITGTSTLGLLLQCCFELKLVSPNHMNLYLLTNFFPDLVIWRHLIGNKLKKYSHFKNILI